MPVRGAKKCHLSAMMPLQDDNATSFPAPVWSDWVNLALLGAERSELPDVMAQAAADMGVAPDEAGTEEIILSAAGSLALLERCARAAQSFQRPLPAPAEEETRSEPSLRSGRHLEAILSGSYPGALKEYLQLLTQHNKVLPAELLFLVLSQADLRADHAQAMAIGGAKGQWLLGQLELARAAAQPRATPVSPARLNDQWREQRRRHPALALTMLQAEWPALPPSSRAAALLALTEGLGPADEPFLENCLDDSRKEVRTTAAELLRQLPNSDLRRRLFERAARCWRMDDMGNILIELPEPLPPESARDGIVLPKAGAAAGWLAQHLKATPVSWWNTHFSQSPQAVTEALGRHRWAAELLPALAEAATLAPDAAWVEALLKYRLEHSLKTVRSEEASAWTQLVQQADAVVLNSVLGQWLDRHGPALPSDHTATRWMAAGSQPWSSAVAQRFWRGFKEAAAQLRARPWDMAHYRGLLERCAYAAPPELLDIFRKDWHYARSGLGRWDDDVEKMLQTLAFRQEMRAELSKP